jgi:hypothetical protein
MNMVICRYNPNHKMKQSRLLLHEESCPDKKGKSLRMCPYNPIHKVTPENYERHKQTCDQRPKVDTKLEQELKDYLKQQGREKKAEPSMIPSLTQSQIKVEILKDKDDSMSSNDNTFSKIPSIILDPSPTVTKYKMPETITNTIGMRKTAVDKKVKRERKTKQKEMMNLIENSEFEESGIMERPHFTQNAKRNIADIDEIYEEDFININYDKQSMNTLFHDHDSHINNTQFMQMIDGISERNDFDPNDSDIFSNKKNKNNIMDSDIGKYSRPLEKSYSIAHDSIILPEEISKIILN